MSEESGQHSESESSDFQDRNSESSEGGLEREYERKESWRLESGSNSEIRDYDYEGESRTLSSSKTISATSITSARNRASANLQSTISDDRSRGSDFDRGNRILTAVRPQSSTGTRIQIASEEALSKNNPSFESPRPGPPPPTLPGGPAHPALQGHRQQRTQHNKGRLMTSREKDALGLEFPNELSTRHKDLLTQGNDPEPNRHHVDENRALNHALRIIRENLNIQDGSLLTIEILREYALKIKLVEPRVQLIHRVSQHKDKKMYLDAPKWLAGANSSKEALAGNLLHSGVICIVYRDYDGSQSGLDFDDEDPDKDEHPKHNSEVIELKSQDLEAAMKAFWKYFNFGVDNVGPTRDIILSSPYLSIFHIRKNGLNSFLKTLEDTKRQEFQYKLVDDMIRKGKITHRYIKYLFKPGDVIVQGNHQDSRGYLSTTWLEEVSQQKLGSDSQTYDLKVQYWGFDGAFSREVSKLTLQVDMKDTSEKTIDDLDLRPLAQVNEPTKERLRRRGDWFWKFRVRHLVSYQEETERGFQGSGNERYMIDMKMFRELHPPEKKTSPVKRDDLDPEVLKQDDPPDDKFIYLTSPTIKGFNLKRKRWLDLEVDKIRPVIWNKQAFKHLVIKEKTKRLIQALISNQIEAERSTDLITGKGNGLIMLLHGGPGTGKTLTAESVAEIAEKPLYPVTCGDIGTKPEEVEEYLESVLHIGKTWGCVVLLDEADVFLEQRGLEDLHRNALVSVFLRVLEYYDGILILTSNRVGTFDEAFKSRIQLALHYKNLSPQQRHQIWGNFLSRLEEINEDGIDFLDLKDHAEELAKHKLNGREIRNVITTARQYVRWERQQPNKQHTQLDYKMMSEVIETAGEFDRYIEKLNKGITYDQMAEDEGLRLGDGV
ncbi:hypothetical protein EV127DRAFT_491479 [Xylaria flabelliformis]|nr:hypothetical protein EV127DRAFT_491479 [Xylaria flabelliformis]